MGGAPSRETLVRHIVRAPRFQGSSAPVAGHSASASANNNIESLTDVPTATSQQPEIILIPLIPDYFPSSASPIFQQLLHVRREANVAYYYRDARSVATEHTVVRDQIGSDEDIYNWYMSLSEQRLLETDNELIALSRAGRVVSPVPCAVAFLYEASATTSTVAAVSAADGAGTSTTDTTLLGSSVGGGKKNGRHGRSHRHGKASGASTSNGCMTIENTVRLPHCNLRVRIFGFVGDTRFCPPSMHHSQAAKLPMCLTIFLSKSAGGNHRVQVTLLAAHTYITQMQAIGILQPHDEASFMSGRMLQGATTRAVFNANATGSEADPLAALRRTAADGVGSAVAACPDPYVDPYSADLSVTADPYAITDEDGSDGVEGKHHLPRHMTRSDRRDGLKTYLEGLGTMATSATADVAKETVLRRPIEIVMHRADVPALCYLRELRARMDQNSTWATHEVNEKSKAPVPVSCATRISTSAMATSPSSRCTSNEEDSCGDIRAVPTNSNVNLKQYCAPNNSRITKMDANSRAGAITTRPAGDAAEFGSQSLKHEIQTVIRADELRGYVAADSIGRVLLWASRFYRGHFEQLVGGEAAKLRQELSHRNLTESPLDGTLLLTDWEPRPPKVTPNVGDVWIPSNDTYIEAHSTQHEGDGWTKVTAGTVLRYVTSASSASTTPAPDAFWCVSLNEFAEDILLSLCRQACQVSRRAPPTDSHWLLSGKTGVPEGLRTGLLIWRELCAGQVVFYGTTPEFLKKWIQSGADVEQVYRNHIKRLHSSKDASSATETESGSATAVMDDSAVAGGQSLSMTAAAIAASSGLHSSYEGNLPSNPAGASDRPDESGGSDGRPCKGSGQSSMELYSAHTGFVSTSVQANAILSPTLPTENDNHKDKSAKPKRSRTGDQPPRPSSSTSPVAVGHLKKGHNVSGTPREDASLGRSLPAQRCSQLAIPVAPGASMVLWTHSSSTVGTPNSHTGVSFVSASMDSYNSSTGFTYRQRSQHRSPAAATTTCWIGIPEQAPADNADAPTVNVVVRQRRSVRATRSCSSTVVSTPLRPSPMNDIADDLYRPLDVPSVPFMSTQPSVVGTTSAASAESSRNAKVSLVMQPRGSLPVRIPGRWESSSEDGSLRQGGHSPTSVEQRRYLLHTGGERPPHFCVPNGATGPIDVRRLPQKRSAAMTVKPGHATGNVVGTPQQAVTSTKWSTTSVAQVSSMHGASITFASGSASSAHARHSSIVHSTRYTEPCPPASSTCSSSLPRSELRGSSFCTNGSTWYGKSSLHPLRSDTDRGDVGSWHALQHTPVLHSNADPVCTGFGDACPAEVSAGTPTVATILMAAAPCPGGEATVVGRSGHKSAEHTPCQGELVNSAKSSIGSGKYRWDWRGVAWPA
ncbi:hypothetical protein, conserved [Leishmania tarentolae]|uniref:Uncharacterized protein n=1 Tax=Leishmania tarentolae TaxID=5689 RepID=A0A640KL75_LEITA|nr:hypothetical protein, conserved [Leishmania tarentolae]